MVKHFPGSGPVDDGKDTHFPPGLQSYKGGNFEYHLMIYFYNQLNKATNIKA